MGGFDAEHDLTLQMRKKAKFDAVVSGSASQIPDSVEEEDETAAPSVDPPLKVPLSDAATDKALKLQALLARKQKLLARLEDNVTKTRVIVPMSPYPWRSLAPP